MSGSPLPYESKTLPQSTGPKLARTMTLWALVIYGVGDMVGSGIYATVGKAAGQMGNAVWLAFVVSMVAAMLTGLSYASIASRYPRAAGAAYVTQRAFRLSFLSYVVGLAVTASGLTSMATSANAFSAVLAKLLGITDALGKASITPFGWNWIDKEVGVILVILAFMAFMTFVNFWGIRESMWTNLLCTAVEVGGLLFIVAVGLRYWGSVNYLETPLRPDPQTGEMARISLGPIMLFSGAVLTFFSFVGFEDMLNVAEEVKQPQRTMPWGILLALGIVTLLYIAVSITAVSVVDYTKLADTEAPLSAISAVAAPWLHPIVFDLITMFAVANTFLINYIMGSRLLYGMARQGLLPGVLGRVHHARRTPHMAILTLLCIVIVLALSGGVSELATTTGMLLLGCFMVVNAALVELKLRKGEPKGKFEVPLIVPVLGIIVNISLIVARSLDPTFGRRPFYIAAVLGVIITVLYFIMRPQAIPEDEMQIESE